MKSRLKLIPGKMRSKGSALAAGPSRPRRGHMGQQAANFTLNFPLLGNTKPSIHLQLFIPQYSFILPTPFPWTMFMNDEILTLKEVAEYMKLAEKTAYRLLRKANCRASKLAVVGGSSERISTVGSKNRKRKIKPIAKSLIGMN